jgi:hypothetical protein
MVPATDTPPRHDSPIVEETPALSKGIKKPPEGGFFADG